MRPELEEVQVLEDYLQGNLNEEQRMDVAVRLLWNQDWQQKLAAQKLAYQALRMAGRQQLRRELDAIYTRLFG
ncbi:hypothetical protein GCM10028803_23390 [Larkinella knui]|uniref:Uncharacterized protein n=1 Tax=Larkinella knui TaxID=2025310 RepID=A0A3P1CW73_9BACT|nr:hypothetical protein [Larkinella knui]RRB17406.1 hypothetical protein EHT87_03735 [Larkinella knui]